LTRALRFGPAASDELVSARDWYEREAGPGVAAEFVDAFWRLTDRLIEWPDASPRRSVRNPDREVRQAGMRSYPYNVVYEVREDALVIIAVAHGK
jgi:plasmid stabilization system protein ParE